MADRFPLILNTSANQIQEIASGDTLDLTNNNIANAGIITASIFSGPIVAGAGVSNITSGIITATQIDLNGDLDVDGHTNLDNVNVGGATTTTGILNITANTASTNTTSGALRVAGGAGIQGSVNIGESVNIDADLDVDGHTNLDNVSIAGVTTFTSASTHVSNANGSVFFGAGSATAYGSQGGIGRASHTNYHVNNSAPGDLCIAAEGSKRIVFGTKAGTGIGGISKRMSITSSGNVSIDHDLDVDGHTNLDNVSVAGVVTATGSGNFGSNLNITGTSPFIDLVDSNSNSDYKFHNDDGTFKIKDMSNANAVRYQLGADGKHYIYGDTTVMGSSNLTVGGNLSVGGVLTYEDVTNVDSVGIVTARSGLKVTGGTSHFVGVANFNETIVGTARTAIKLTCTDESTDTTTYPLFVAATTGDQFPKTGTNLSFNSANGTLTATTFSGSGASLTSLPAANLTGTAAAINGSNITNVNAATVGGIAASSFLRSDASTAFNCNGFNFSFDFDTSGRDSIQFTQGGSLRFQLVHSNSGNDIDIIKHGSAADIKIAGARILTTADEGTGNGLDADTVDGIQGSNIVTLSGSQTIAGTKTFNCSGYDVQLDYDNTRTLVSILRSGSEKVRMHSVGDTILVETFNSGVIRWKSGLVPNADDTYDLGATGTRWRNLYVNDLQLSNESKKDKGGNDVDGTWGDWTLQEGDENIFMLNNRTGKKYKMNLTEVE